MRTTWVMLLTLSAISAMAGCSSRTIDFSCELPGRAVVYVGQTEYVLPATITIDRDRRDLRFVFPTSSKGTVRARGEIILYPDYAPTDLDNYGRLRAVFTRKLIDTVEQGGAAVFDGYSVSKQHVFRLMFGKE